MPLSPQKEQFVAEYLVDGDAIQAMVRSGCPAGQVLTLAPQWLADPEVIEAIAHRRYARAVTYGISDQWMLTRLLTIVERCMEPRPVMSQTSDGMQQVRSAEGEGVWSFDSVGATAALELLGKHIGFFGRHNQQQYPGPSAPDYRAPDVTPEGAQTQEA
jgi:hypothetical protein